MTCKQILDLIDVLPDLEQRSPELESVEGHARACDRCRADLALARLMRPGLAALPQPAPPAALTAATMARIERLEDNPAVVGHGARRPVTAARARRAWAAAISGYAAGVGALVLVVLSSGVPPDFTSSRIGGSGTGLVSMPTAAPVALVLVAGLLVYLAGLFAPLRVRDDSLAADER